MAWWDRLRRIWLYTTLRHQRDDVAPVRHRENRDHARVRASRGSGIATFYENAGAMFKDGLKNMAWGLSQQWIGGSQVMWLQEHVVLHHMHTGDVHMDPDAQMAPVRSRRPAVLRRLHAIDARRFQERRS